MHASSKLKNLAKGIKIDKLILAHYPQIYTVMEEGKNAARDILDENSLRFDLLNMRQIFKPYF